MYFQRDVWRPKTQSKKTIASVQISDIIISWVILTFEGVVKSWRQQDFQSLKHLTSSVFGVLLSLAYLVSVASSNCFYILHLIQAPQSNKGQIFLSTFCYWRKRGFHWHGNLLTSTDFRNNPLSCFSYWSIRCSMGFRKWNYLVFKNFVILLNKIRALLGA